MIIPFYGMIVLPLVDYAAGSVIRLTEVSMRVENAPFFGIDSRALCRSVGITQFLLNFIASGGVDLYSSSSGCQGAVA